MTSHYSLHQGDAREVLQGLEDESVDLVLSDPPYLEEFIPLYGDLAREAGRVLKQDGFLIFYTGQYHLETVMKMVADVPALSYFWLVSQWNMSGMAKIMSRRQICGFKPILIYRKGKALPNGWPLDILTMGGRSKKFHAWEQDVKEARYLVQHYSRPGDLVLDPFLGSGTTGVAALQTGREFTGIEIDPATFAIASTRIGRAAWQSHAETTIQALIEEFYPNVTNCYNSPDPVTNCYTSGEGNGMEAGRTPPAAGLEGLTRIRDGEEMDQYGAE
ncbi:MAG: DNA methyltransferase [Bacilli bacterium]